MGNFENQLKASEAIGDGVANNAKYSIALAKSKDEGVNDTEELLKAPRELYEWVSLIMVKRMNTRLLRV